MSKQICICSDGYPFEGFSFSTFIQVLAREFVRKGYEIIVVAPQSLSNHFIRGSNLVPKFYYDDFENYERKILVYRPYTITFGEGLLGKLTHLCNRFFVERQLKKIKLNCDIFYAHFWHSAYNVVRFANKQNKCLFVATGEDKISFTKYLNRYDLDFIKSNVSGTICVSSKNRTESVSLGLAEYGKCEVIPNAFDPKEFYKISKFVAREKLGINQDDFIIAFCGRFNNRKGALRVAEAVRFLNDKSIKTIFIGSVADNEKEMPECPGILFMDNLPHNEIVNYLNCADVFILPSLAEGCPNSVIEAMACGLPIISSDLPFNHDILDKENAILIDPLNIEEIAESIRKLKDDETYRNSLAEKSLKKSEQLTIDKRVEKILGFINSKLD